MSIYYVNKLLFRVDGNPDLLAQYKSDPAGLVDRWEADYGHRLGTNNSIETTSWLEFTDQERRALIGHDYVTLFEIGAHFFLCLTIFIAIYDEDYARNTGPLSFQREYARSSPTGSGGTIPRSLSSTGRGAAIAGMLRCSCGTRSPWRWPRPVT